MTFYYGVKDREHIERVINAVCLYLGSNAILAGKLLMETCAAETQLCTYPDRHPEKLGVGGFQFDQIALDDLKQETNERHKRKIERLWGFVLDDIELHELADDFLLAAICCRLKYMRVPAAIPDNYLDRAAYWKRYYNTSTGKGTIEHYLNAAEAFDLGGDDELDH